MYVSIVLRCQIAHSLPKAIRTTADIIDGPSNCRPPQITKYWQFFVAFIGNKGINIICKNIQANYLGIKNISQRSLQG
jgi:hypothetical protein